MQKDDMNTSASWTGSSAMRLSHARPKRSPSAPTRLLALTAVLAGATALAQPTGLGKLELERLTLNPSGTGSLLLGTGELLPKGGMRLSAHRPVRA